MKDTATLLPLASVGGNPNTSAVVAAAAAAAQRRPRAQSMQHFSEKTSIPRDCCSSGSFVSKLYRMVDSEPSTIVSWIRGKQRKWTSRASLRDEHESHDGWIFYVNLGGTAFCIVDPKMMAEHCLPKYFRHRRFSSLIRQLNFYSFYRVQEGQLTIYQHSFFRKGRPDLLVHIKRRGAGKAKDPWFDPLASGTAPAKPQVNLSVIGCNMNDSNGLVCCSPMSKPLTMENMSPALKPSMAPASIPPMVDLGSSLMSCPEEKPLEDKRWENQFLKDHDQKFPMASLQVNSNDMFYMDSNTAMGKTVPTPGQMDIDIQDFFADDCSINAGMEELKSQLEDGLCGNNMSNMMMPMNPKSAMVSRDCFKWDTEEDQTPTNHVNSGTFEDELLFDLANVEPGAWEVPLSPLNDEEDMMPWLDVCF